LEVKKDKEGYFKLNGHRYRVFFEDLGKYKDKDADEDETLFGMVNHSQLVVAINNLPAKSKQAEALIHEILHCILAPAGYEESEMIIRVISGGLNQLGVGEYLIRNVRKSKGI